MTDFANLAIKIDSTEAGDAARDLDRLTQAGKRTDVAINKLGDTADTTGSQMRGAGRAASDYAAAAQMAARNTTQVGETGKLARHHVQNLAFQFQDLGVQMAMAAQSGSPLKMTLMALMQQGSQISGIMGQAGLSVGGLAKQMASGAASMIRAHPIIAAIGAAAGVAASAFGFMSDEINKNAKVQVTWGDTALGVWDAAKSFLTGQLSSAFEYFGTTTQEVWKDVVGAAKTALNWIIGAVSLVPRVAIAAFSTIGPAIGDGFYSGVNLAIRALNWLIRKTVEGVNIMVGALNKALSFAPGGLQLPTISAPQISEVANSYAGAGRKFGDALGGAFKDTVNRDYLGEFSAYISPFAQARARKRLEDDAEGAGKGAGGKLGKAMGKSAADTFSDEFARDLDDTMNGFLSQFSEMKKTWVSNDAAALADMQAEQAKAQDARIKGALEEAEARRRVNNELRDTIDSLDKLGGFGSSLGDVGALFYGAKTGDFSGARGSVGYLAQSILTKTTTNENGEVVRSLNGLGLKFSDALDKVFGKNGSFTNLLQGAGVGVAVGQTLFGKNNKGAEIGGALGGAAGQLIGGPVGNIIGSVLGSALGSLFTKRPRGSGSVSNTGVLASANDAGIQGDINSFGLGLQSAISALAQQLGGSVGAYSVGLGRYKDYYQVSSNANDPKLGQTYFNKKSSSAVYDGLDAEAAMRAAILAAIEQGAITGIREGAQRLLKGGKDIEAQLAKALKFQGVFDELKEATDPLGFALDGIAKQFTELRTIFAEAGASAEEYAQLEQLLAVKRAEAADQARQSAVDKVRDPIEMQIRLLELLGKEEDAVAASRLLELAGLKQTLQPMQAMIYQLEDARKVIDTFEPLAADLRDYRKELMGGGGEQSFGYVAAQFRSIAAAAAGGDKAALGNLRGAAGNYLGLARLNAGSDLEYRRALGSVLASVDKGIFAAETQVDYAQAQIDAINNSANIMEQMRSEMATLQGQVVENTGFVARLWSRFETNGLPVITNQDEPLQVEVTA